MSTDSPPSSPSPVVIAPQPPPANFYEAAIRAAERFGIPTVGAIIVLLAFGFAVRVVYQDQKATNEARWIDNKVHQQELMAYLTNRNDSDAKRAVSDAELARSLQRLADAMDQMRFEARTAHTTSKTGSP